jgi:hypothetical protein
MVVAACNDNLTGQDGEPHGALKVTKLTLNDSGLNRVGIQGARSVVTDTSVPPDCSAASAMNLPQCTADPFKDKYGVLKSPPNPDSAHSLRVIFNKAPMLLGGKPLEPIPDNDLPTTLPTLSDPTVLSLSCQNCSTDNGAFGVPPSYNSLEITGTELSPDPGQYAYGPSLEMEALANCSKSDGPATPLKCMLAGLKADPFRALEPGSTYTVTLNPALSARIGDGTDNVLLDDAAKALLTFTTEPFQVLYVGLAAQDPNGNLADNSVWDSTMNGDGSTATPYTAGALAFDAMGNQLMNPQLVANEGAIAVTLNAPVDDSMFVANQTATATVTANGTNTMVPVIISAATGMPKACVYANRRTLYIAPMAGTWTATPGANVTVDVTLRGSDIRDLSQLPNHPAGKGVHVLSKDAHIRATLLATPADMSYPGVLATAVVPSSMCN